MNQNIMLQATQFQKQYEELSQHLEIINQQIEELEQFGKQLSSMNGAKGKELLAPVGKGVYVRTELKDEKLLVQVGAGVILKKTPEQTIETIKGQLKRLLELKVQYSTKLDQIQDQLQQMVMQMEQQGK